MPNGRSGGFIIETADLKQLVRAVSETAVVGHLTRGLRLKPANVAEIAQRIEECPLDRIAVEEQDHTFYIIHLSNEPDIVWVSVNSKSPIFGQLRERHAQWMAEHPGWKGWIGF